MEKCKNVTIVVENGGEVVLRIQGAQVPSTNQMCNASVSAEPVAVDLGLPSGRLWCDRNVGAQSPEDCGAFFSWGNTELHYLKKNTDWGNNYEAFEDIYSFDEDTYAGTPGAELEGDIDPEHDAARVNMGDPWRIPSASDFQELYEYCEWERKTVNGVNGYLVTSKLNGKTLFFPCCGYGNGTSRNSRGSLGYYWSSSLYSQTHGRYLSFGSGGVYPQNVNYRFYGFVGRAVQ